MEWLSQIKPPFGTPLALNHWANQGKVVGYAMNEFGGDKVYDSTLNGNIGTLIGMAPMSPTSGWVPGPHGGALAFNGSDDYVDCGNKSSLDFTTLSSMTIMATVFISTASNFCIFNKWSASKGYVVACFSNMMLRYYCDGQGKYSANPLMTTNRWTNITCTFDGSDQRFRSFIDGALKDVSDPFTSLSSTSQHATIGGTSGGFAYFNGLISSVSIYNVVRQPDEIAYLNEFPWCMYEMGAGAWEYNRNSIPVLQNYYQQMRAA